MEIDETEEYLGFLRERQAVVQKSLREADEQVGAVRNALRSDGISELSDDDEDTSSNDSMPAVFSDQTIPPTSSYITDVDNSDNGKRGSDSSINSSRSSSRVPFPLSQSAATSPSTNGVKHNCVKDMDS